MCKWDDDEQQIREHRVRVELVERDGNYSIFGGEDSEKLLREDDDEQRG